MKTKLEKNIKCKYCKKKIKYVEELYQIPTKLMYVHKECKKPFIDMIVDKVVKERKNNEKKWKKIKKENNKSKIKQTAWMYFSKFIRLRDSDKNGKCKCITCGQIKQWNDGMDAGHYIPKSKGEQFYFNEDNVNGQCRYCNSYRSQQDLPYRENLIKKIGIKRVERLEKMKNERSNKKMSTDDYRELSKKYRLKFNKLKK